MTIPPPPNPNLNLRLVDLSHQHAQPTIDLLCDAFHRDHTYSWARVLNQSPDELRSYLTEHHVVRLIGGEPSSIVALLIDENGEEQVVGALTMERFHRTPDPSIETSEGDGAIIRIMQAGEHAFLDEAKRRGVKEAERAWYIAFVGTEPGTQRKGVAKALVLEAMKRIEEGGYSTVLALTTSPKSTALFNGAGFEKWGEVGYGSFEVDGKRPFEEIPDGMSVMVWRR